MCYLRSIVVYIWAIFVLVMSRPYLTFCNFYRNRDYYGSMNKIYIVANTFAKSILFLIGVKLRVKGIENIPSEGSLLFVGNHQSQIDIPVLIANINRPVGFLAKREMEKVPLMSAWIDALQSVYIDREENRKALEAIIKASKLLVDRDHALAVFPEGTRSIDGAVGEFKAGSLKIALRSKCIIVPFAINGTQHILEKNSFVLNKGNVNITFLDPIKYQDYCSMDTVELTKICRNKIIIALKELQED